MKRRLLILIAVALLFCGCNADKRIVNISTASSGGALYPIGSAVAGVFNAKLEGVKAFAQASNGGIENLNLIKMKEIDLGFAVTSIVYQSYKGEGPFERRADKDLRVLAGLYYNPNQITVAKGINARGIEDLKGLRFSPGAAGSTAEQEAKVHFEAAGMDYPGSIRASYVGFSESIDLMRNKSLDGAWIMAGVPNASVTEAISVQGAKLVPVSEEIINKLREKYPWYAPYIIKKEAYDKLENDVMTSSIKMALFTRKDLDDELVYKMTKAFWESADELKKTNPALSEIEIKNALTDLAGVPVHDGAMKYYRERGVKGN